MSCYIIDMKDMKKIVLAFRKFAAAQHTYKVRIPGDEDYSDLTEIETMSRVGQILVDQNCRSYNYRYGEETEPEAFEITGKDLMYGKRLTPVETLKALASYDYQSCETPDYYETNAFKLADLIRHYAIEALPGYDDARWI